MKWQGILLFLAIQALFLNVFAVPPLKKPIPKPPLLVVIVIDQLRADYLTRFEKRFLPEKKNGTLGGFKYLMAEGAYFPIAEYDVIQSMTCPGHAMISTGSHPVLNGIVLNDWYDKKLKKEIYCAEDSEYGLSPRNLKTTTFSDELKNAGYKSQVVGIAVKDRSAIMLAGHRADHVYWINDKTQWETSTYYNPTKLLPNWVENQNNEIKKLLGKDSSWISTDKTTGLTEESERPFGKVFRYGDKASIGFPFGVDITMNLANAAIKELKLGKSSSLDVLNISLSSHDILGHEFGPNAREMEEMIVYEDRALSKFFNGLKSQGLLDNTVIVLTSDHGVAPTVEYLKKNKIQAERFNLREMIDDINSYFDKKYGPPKNKRWLASHLTLNFYFDRETLAEKKLNLHDLELEAAEMMLKNSSVLSVLKSTEEGFGLIPDLRDRALRQWDGNRSGDLVLIPKPFHIPEGKARATHLTGFSYDRSVPLILAGKGIKAGIYPHQANILDLAPTLSFLYGVLPPATSSGKILEIFE